MIVKIQTSLDSSDGVQRVLIYNKDKPVQYDHFHNQHYHDKQKINFLVYAQLIPLCYEKFDLWFVCS